MVRFFPKAEALYLRARRSVLMILTGVALMAPAGATVLQQQMVTRREAELEAQLAAAKAVDGPIAQAWRAREEERQRIAAAADLAAEYEVPGTLARQIHTAATEEKVDPRIAFGLVQTESSFRRNAVSYAGAVGYTQLLPSTARWLAPGTTRQDLFEGETNLRIGFRYLSYLIDKYDGDVRLALTAYNRGPGTVDRLVRRGRNPENGYADKVLRRPPAVKPVS